MRKMQEDISALFRVLDRMRKAWQNVTPCDTLNKSQFSTLLAIAHPEVVCGPPPPGTEISFEPPPRPVRLTDLARAMRQSLPALSQRVSALEALGYIEREPDPADRRVTGVRATPEGLRVLEQAYKRFDGMLTRAIERLGQDDLRMLLELLVRLTEGLEASAADPDGTGKPVRPAPMKPEASKNKTGSENDT